MVNMQTVLHYSGILLYAVAFGLSQNTDLTTALGLSPALVGLILQTIGERIGKQNVKQAAEALPEPPKSASGQPVPRLRQLLTLAVSEAYSQGNTALVTHLNETPFAKQQEGGQ